MIKRIFSTIIVVIILGMTLTSCYSYKEINKITFVTSVIFDRDEYDNVLLYLDCVSPYRNANESSDKGRRILFQGNGKTALEAVRDINVESSNDLDFSQVRSYIFTEQAARKGIDKYIDLIQNNQQFGYSTYMFVYFGEKKSLLSVINDDEEYLGLYLDQLVQRNKDNGKVISSNLNSYLTNSLDISKISFMSAIELKKDVIQEKIQLNGGVIMKDNHMIDRLEDREAINYNLLANKVTGGSIQIVNPNERDKFISLDILENSIETEVEIQGEEVILKKDLTIKASIGEIQGKLSIDKNVINLLNSEVENKVNVSLENFFKESQKKGIDIFRVSRLVEEKYPYYNNEDTLKNTKLITNIRVIIDGGSLLMESL
jgi:Ger(x)C family germination protein